MKRALAASRLRLPQSATWSTCVLRAAFSSASEVVDGAAAGPAGFTAASAVGSTLADRYAALVAAGTLRHDAQQAGCVERLERLRVELAVYKEQVAAYQQEFAAYQQRRQALQSQLVQEEEARLLAEEHAAVEATAAASGRGLASWLGSALGKPDEPAPQRRTRHQRKALARSRVEQRLQEQLGPPPPPPAAPRGVYLHGSVGSGKSLLMDLLSVAVQHQEGEQDKGSSRHQPRLHHRRLHFNSAMLELHSRMHAIESSRTEQERAEMETYAAAVRGQQQRDQLMRRQQQQQQQQQASSLPAGSSGHGDRETDGAAAAGLDGDSGDNSLNRAAWQQILRLDPISQKLRRSKLARLAFRRMMRDKLSRSPSQHSAALAAANAPVLLHAARAMIRNCDTLQLLRSPAVAPPAAATAEAGAAGAGSHGGRIAALLCFDEVQVSDPFTAVALKGLMEALLAEGCVVVATSNRAPWELDRHGLHEELFTHFVRSLQSACDVLRLDSDQDYRRLLAQQAPLLPLAQLPGAETSASHRGAGDCAAEQQGQAAEAVQPHPKASYFYPLGPAAAAALRQQWRRLTRAELAPAAPAESAAELAVMFGRRLAVERCSGGVAWFRFEELCARPLGAADYVAVAQAFHTVFIEGVPQLSMQVRDQARRFITLVDELYQHRTRLVCSAAAPPDHLFAGAGSEEPIVDLESLQFETAVEGSRLRRNLMADGGVAPVASTAAEAADAARRLGGAEERFAFARAVSRLYEMQSELYLVSRPRQP